MHMQAGFNVRKGSTNLDKNGVLRVKYFLCSKEGEKKEKLQILFIGQKKKLRIG